MTRRLPKGMSYGQPIQQFWGKGYDGPPVVGTGSLSQQVGTNHALADFFELMLNRRFKQMDFRREQRAMATNDARDQSNALERYQAQHANLMDESAWREALKTGTSGGYDWRSSTIFGGDTHVDGAQDGSGIIQGPALPGFGSAGDSYVPDPSLMTQAQQDNAQWAQDQISGKTHAAASQASQDQQGNSDHGGGFLGGVNTGLDFITQHTPLGAVEDAAKNAGAEALDIISRPLYASANAAKAYFSLDKSGKQAVDPQQAVAGKNWFSFITGGKTGASMDEIRQHPLGSIKTIGSAAWEGLKGHDKTTYADVIRQNAAADGVTTPYDSPIMQGAVGFLGDVAFDPTSYIGGEVVSVPAKAAIKGATAARDLARTNKVRSISEDLANIMPASREFVAGTSAADTTINSGRSVSADRYFKMLGGDFKAPRTSAERAHQINTISDNVDQIISQLHTVPIEDNKSASAAIESLGKALARRREQVVNDFAGQTVLDSLRKKLEIKIAKGEEPPSALSDLERTITEDSVSKIIPDARAFERSRQDALRQVAKDFNIGFNREKGTSELDNLMKEYDRLQSIKNPSDKIKKKADALYKAIDKATNPEGKDLTDLLGPSFKHDLRFENVDTRDLFLQSEKLAWQDASYKSQAGASKASQDNINKIQNYIKAAEAKGDHKRVAELQNELEHAVRRKGHADRIKDRVQAYYLIQLLKRELATQKGMTTFSDPKVAKAMDDLLSNHVQPELNAIRNGERVNYTYSGVEKSRNGEWVNNNDLGTSGSSYHNTDIAVDGTKVTDSQSFGAVNQNHSLDNSLPEDFVDASGKWHPSVLDPHPAFYDRVSHLEHMSKTLQRQLKQAEGVTQPIRKVVTTVPDKFVKDGKFSLPMLRSRISFASSTGHTKAGVFSVNRVKDETPADKKWLNEVTKVLTETYDPKFRQLRDKYMVDVIAEENKAAETASKQAIGTKVVVKKDWPKRNAAIQKAAKEASESAFKTVGNLIEHNRLTLSDYSTELKLAPVGQHSSEQDLLQALAAKRGDEYAQAWHQAKLQKVGAADAEVKSIDQQMLKLREKHAEALRTEKALKQEAVKARKLMEHRLREDALLRVAAVKLAHQNKAIKLNFLGKEMFNIPGSETMFKTMDQLGGVVGIKQIRQIWADAFKSPTTRLAHEKDLKLAYLRAMNNTPEIIALHVRDLKDQFGHISEAERINTFRSWLHGDAVPTGSDQTQDAIKKSFDEILPYFNLGQKVGGIPLEAVEINRYLPREFQLAGGSMGNLDTPQKLIKAMSEGKTAAELKKIEDPYRVAWASRIAIEQAIARKGLAHTLNESFGIPTGKLIGGKSAGKIFDKETEDLLTKFKGLGWKTVDELGGTHYFPPELVHDIGMMMKLMEPRNISKFGNLVDKGTGYWKTAVTVYNPGYYTRNGIGEIMSSWFGGVNDPEYYRRALHVMRYVKHDGQDLQALKSHMPLLDLKTESQAERGRKVVGKLKGGKEVTAEEAWVAYHDQGLKTGFFSTEFDSHYSRTADKLHQKAGEQLGNVHDAVRSKGERYEDYLRMGHFLHALEHSGAKDLKTAAEHAADQVRKYHFDYQDFTKFEKMVMLRAFPFYKWTRKAAPLMMTMMFMKPGKFLVYPKAMNSISDSISTSDMVDNNGLAPNYEGIVPGWMQDMWAYKIAEGAGAAGGGMDQGTGDTYFNMATPQMDSFKSVIDPGGSFMQFLNPMVKVPLEQLQGQSLGNMRLPVQSGKQRGSELMRMTPQTNFLNKMAGSNSDKGNALLSFMSGLGFYGNTKERQQAELRNRSK